MLARLQLGAPGERKPSGEARDAERHGETVGQPLGKRIAGAGRDQRALRHRAPGQDGRVEVDPLAVAERAHSLAAGDARDRRRSSVEGARADRDVDRVEPGCPHLDELLFRARLGLAELAGSRDTQLMQNGRSHASCSLGKLHRRRGPRCAAGSC